MTIWIFCHYAGRSSGFTRCHDLGRRLVGRGHRVTVLASSFDHWRLRDDRLGAGETWKEDEADGVRFVWVRTASYQANDWRRSLNMLTYAWRSVRAARALGERPDVVVGSSPHLFAPLGAWIAARWARARFVFEIRDLWPQILVEMGRFSARSPVTRVLRALEGFLYRRADRIVSLIPYAAEYVAGRGVPAARVVWVPNGVDVSRDEGQRPYDGGGLGPFTVMYVGGLQEYNGLDALLEAARVFQARGKEDVRFVLVGDGTDRRRLEEQARRLDLRHVEFRGLVPKTEVFKVMAEADVLFHSFRRLPVYRYGVSPVKISEYLLAGRPILFAVEGGNDPVEEAGAGITIPPEDPAALVDAVTRLRALTPEARVAMGRRGQTYARRELDIEVLTDRFERAVGAEAERTPAGSAPADAERPRSARYARLKRGFDVLAAAVLLVLLAAPILLVFALIRLTSRGPALYCSDRVGIDNTIFRMYKFRTMRLETPAVATHLFRDYRSYLTPLGRVLRVTSLDELPQLLNILKGEMSFVGPRPALYNQDDLVALRTAKGVHRIPPGLTGWAQVNGRDDISIPVKVELDEHYLRHASFAFDLLILWRTAFKVARRENIAH